MNDFLRLLISIAALISGLPASMSAAEPDESAAAPTNVIKEVLRREDGKDRHWVVRSNSMIVQEHGLTAHGDLHVMVEYPDGVKTPQIDAPKHDTNAVSVMTVFWPSGKRMSRTSQVGGSPHGEDRIWWPNGKIAREAHFARGHPDGVWKYFDQKGHQLGEGTFLFGGRQSGVFFGNDSPGGNYFFSNYPMKKSRFENGHLEEARDWLTLKELGDAMTSR
jgi:hypothetical protein